MMTPASAQLRPVRAVGTSPPCTKASLVRIMYDVDQKADWRGTAGCRGGVSPAGEVGCSWLGGERVGCALSAQTFAVPAFCSSFHRCADEASGRRGRMKEVLANPLATLI
jgi:hypothetical protein